MTKSEYKTLCVVNERERGEERKISLEELQKRKFRIIKPREAENEKNYSHGGAVTESEPGKAFI